jgi:hypothetical protein
MTALVPAPHRRRWHPAAGALALALVASIVDGLALVGAGPDQLVPVGWALLAAAAGFATSGST